MLVITALSFIQQHSASQFGFLLSIVGAGLLYTLLSDGNPNSSLGSAVIAALVWGLGFACVAADTPAESLTLTLLLFVLYFVANAATLAVLWFANRLGERHGMGESLF